MYSNLTLGFAQTCSTFKGAMYIVLQLVIIVVYCFSIQTKHVRIRYCMLKWQE
jgi:hypothetical protein